MILILCFALLPILVVPFSVTSLSTNSLTLSWIFDEDSVASSYIISYFNTDCPSDKYSDIIITDASIRTYRLTDLQEGTTYSFRFTTLLSDGTVHHYLRVTTMSVGQYM